MSGHHQLASFVRRALVVGAASGALLTVTPASASAVSCPVHQKTPQGFQYKCDQELSSDSARPASRTFYQADSPQQTVTGATTGTPGLTCAVHKVGFASHPEYDVDCDGVVPANTEVHVSLTMSGWTPCTADGHLTVHHTGDDGVTSIGALSPCAGGGGSKRPTKTHVACKPSTVALGKKTSCTATVSDTGAGTKSTPTGSVAFSASAGTGSFNPTKCTLGPTATKGVARCKTSYKPTSLGKRNIHGAYGGDGSHLGSSDSRPINVKRGTSTKVSCTPASIAVRGKTHCTATVRDTTKTGSKSAPLGTVKFKSTAGKGTFTPTASCKLKASGAPGSSQCSVTYTATAAGKGKVVASYGGDSKHTGSSGKAPLTVK